MRPSIAEIILDDALDKSLDYLIPEDLKALKVGMRVEVPLRGRSAKGIILALKEKSAFSKLKPLTKPLSDIPLITPELFELAYWISSYYSAPLSKILKTMLPPSLRDEKAGYKTQSFVKPLLSQRKLKEHCITLRDKHSAQALVLDLLLQSPQGLFLTEILEKAGISRSPITTLEKQNIIQVQAVKMDRSPIFDHDFFPTKPKTLTEEQQTTLDAILKSKGHFHTHLIHGVTGSGKTEVYLQAIDSILKNGQGVVYLIPEIALTSQTIERFKGRFGSEGVAILHHRLSSGEKHDAWHKIREGKVRIVVGARSAIFSPIPNLGMIIVDEEHESSYKQSDETPKYHARDVAVVRGKLSSCPVILGSATPSLESYANAMEGKYSLHVIKNRADNARLPTVQIIDMQKEFEKAGGFTLFSAPLLDGIKARLALGEQVLLFLNRRGYHTSAMCIKCGHVETCIDCDLSLTYHRGENSLACHLCDHRKEPPKSCPSCHKDGPLKFKGAGTEMLEKSLHALFPEVRTLRLDADTTRHKGSHERLFKAFRSGKADILIGTQMIAKGLHFPQVTLVGVIGLDGSLNIPDFRAGENVFQLLTQVAGRSGRGELAGEVIIQTHLPHNEVIQLAARQDYEAFYAGEMEVRKLFGFPPHTHLIKFSFSGSDLQMCEKSAQAFRKELIAHLPKGVEILPLVPCGYAKIKGKYRFQCLLKTEKIGLTLKKIEVIKKHFKGSGDARLSVDVDPITTFF